MRLLILPLLLLLIAPGVFAADGVGKTLLSDPVSTGSIFQLILMLLLVVGFILLAAWFFRRMGQFGMANNQTIRYLGGISVGQRERVVLVEVGGTQLLLGVAPGRVQTLLKLENPIEPDTAEVQSSFAKKLAELVNKKESAS